MTNKEAVNILMHLERHVAEENGYFIIQAQLMDATLLAIKALRAQQYGHWIDTPPYYASNGQYNKGQECSVCHAFFVSPGNTPYSNHPYCCECGAKMDGGKS